MGKRTLHWIISIVCLATSTWGAEVDSQRSFYIELSDIECWTLKKVGNYHCRYDVRDLYCMYHLYSTAAKNDQSALTTSVTIPVDWEPPFGLELFCSDDYQVRDDQKPADGWMACHAYPNHRFKQILVDQKIVWEADVADAGVAGQVAVDLTEHVTPGRAFELTLRVIDKIGTETKTSGEHFWAGGFTPGSWQPTEDPRAFPTHVYWGDVLLTERFDPQKLRPLREMVSVRTLRERIARGELTHDQANHAKLPATLFLEAPAGAPLGWPISCGVLLPAGAIFDARQLRLTDRGGRPIAIQCDAISEWPDNSLRSVRVIFSVPAGLAPGDPVLLSWDDPPVPVPPQFVRADRQSNHLIVRNDQISLQFAGEGQVVIQEVTGQSQQRLAGPMKVYLDLENDDGSTTRYDAFWKEPELLSHGSQQVSVLLRGKLAAPDSAKNAKLQELGSCTLRLKLTDGSPLVRTWFRFQNETSRHLKVIRLVIQQEVAPGTSRGAVATLEQPAGWFAADAEQATVFAAVRWAAETPTKKLKFEDDRLVVELFGPTDQIPFFRPRSGEAKRTEFLLGYYDRRPEDDALRALARAVQRPPRLWSSPWACATAALGKGEIHDTQHFPKLTENRARSYGELQREKVGHVHYDMRHFGDRRYHDNQWCNNYYDGIRGYLAEYLMTANPNAFDRAAEAVSHAIDIDQCHWWPDEKMIGGMWSYSGTDHSDAGYHWSAQQRTLAGLVYYYRLTGDPDVRESLRLMADYALTHNTGYRSVRDHAGILTALVWAYDELREDRYLKAALETMTDVHAQMSRRRGPYLEPNANWSFLVSIPWMAAELADAHYHLWQLTGNVEAAATALGIADSLIQENGTWDVPGEMGGYSGYPHFQINSSYHIILAPVVGYGYEMTGDPRFLLWARACFDRTLAEDSVDSLTNNYWLTPRLLYLVQRYRDVETATPSVPAVRVPPNFSDPIKK
jgi:hypothetical protein